MKIITGTTGSAHITPKQDAMWHRGLQVIPSCVFNEGECFATQIMSNSLIRVKDGICSIQGRYMCIEPNTYDEVQIENGSQGMKRIDMICVKLSISEGGVSTASLEVFRGTPDAESPVPPTIPTHDLDAGDNEAYLPIANVFLDGINIESTEFIGTLWTLVSKVSDAEAADLVSVLGEQIIYG